MIRIYTIVLVQTSADLHECEQRLQVDNWQYLSNAELVDYCKEYLSSDIEDHPSELHEDDDTMMYVQLREPNFLLYRDDWKFGLYYYKEVL